MTATHYAAAVIGAGMAGLTAGAVTLGLADRLPFRRLEVVDQIYLPDLEFQVLPGRAPFTARLSEIFPHQRERIERLVEWLELFKYGAERNGGGAEAMRLFMKHYNRTYEEFLDEMVEDERLKAFFALRIQADPASLMIMAGFLTECYLKGMYYLPGGSHRLPLELAAYIQRQGGSVLTRAPVVGVDVEGDSVRRLHLADGREFTADAFVANCDVHRLFKQMLNVAPPEPYIKAMDGRKVGHSSLNIYLIVEGLALDHLRGGRIYLCNSYDIFGIYRQIESGQIPDETVIKIHIPSLNDPSLVGEGQHVIRIETDLYLEDGDATPEETYRRVLPQRFLRQAEERVIPGLRDHIRWMKVTTTRQFGALYQHTHGSGTGWAHTVANSVLRPFQQTTPYPNLFVAGQWGEFSSGLRQLVLSGQKAANAVLRLSSKG